MGNGKVKENGKQEGKTQWVKKMESGGGGVKENEKSVDKEKWDVRW